MDSIQERVQKIVKNVNNCTTAEVVAKHEN